jgi:MFS family permease
MSKIPKHGQTIVCLCLSALSMSAPLNGLSPSLSVVAHDMGFSPQERDLYLGGYISLSTMFGQMVGSVTGGIVVDNRTFSRKTILLVTIFTGAIAMILFGLVDHFPSLLVLRV